MPLKIPTVSVLISVHNGAATLDRCFESLKNQSFQDFNIICVNDGSKDESWSILMRWQEKFSDRLHLISQKKNRGLTYSLNQGLKEISAPFTARIDADDWWDPEKLEKQVSFLKNHPKTGLLGTAYVNVYPRHKKTICPPQKNSNIKDKIFGYNPFAHSTVIFKTALVQKLGGYDEEVYYGQDYDLWLRLLPYTEFANLPDTLCFRTADVGISREKQRDQIWQYMKTQWKYIRLYHYPLKTYTNFLRPLIVLMTPDWLKKIKYGLDR